MTTPTARILSAVAAAWLLNGCGDPQSDALSDLTENGYDLSVPAYFRTVESGQVEALPTFIEAGVAVDVPNAQRETALQVAVRVGRRPVVEWLLMKGAKIPPDREAFMLSAVTAGDAELVELLLKKGVALPGKDELVIAAAKGNGEMLDALLRAEAKGLDAALRAAASGGHLGAVDRLLVAGADLFARDPADGGTVLHRAAASGSLPVCDLLLQAGLSRFGLTSDGKTAAEVAAEAGHGPLADALRKKASSEELEIGVVKGDSEDAAPPVISDGIQTRRRLASINEALVGKHSALVELSEDVTRRLNLRQIRESQFPLMFDGVDGANNAVFSRTHSGRELAAIAVGEAIPGVDYCLKEVRQTGLPWCPVACVLSPLKDPAAPAVLVGPGFSTRTGALCAVIEARGTDEVYEALAGDKFRLDDFPDMELRVVAVLPRAVELSGGGKTWILLSRSLGR